MEDRNRGSGMKMLMGAAVIAFFVTLAVVIGKRMSSDAIAIVIGVACGVVASIPTSLIILAVTSRSNPRIQEYNPPPPQTPPVIVIQGGRAESPTTPLLGRPSLHRPKESRQFELVGQVEEEVWE